MTNQTIDGVPLLPCPFCGAQVSADDEHSDDCYFTLQQAFDENTSALRDSSSVLRGWNRRHSAGADPSLLQAAIKVLNGLNERIDAAIENRTATPIFDGIADLHNAINKDTP